MENSMIILDLNVNKSTVLNFNIFKKIALTFPISENIRMIQNEINWYGITDSTVEGKLVPEVFDLYNEKYGAVCVITQDKQILIQLKGENVIQDFNTYLEENIEL